MKILVTGATGLIGSALVQQLVDQGEDVRIFRRETSSLALLGEAAEAVEHATGDVTDALSLYYAMEGVDHVYHTAALLGVGSGVSHNELRHINVKGTGNVVDAALEAEIDRLVHTSSMATLGRPLTSGTVIDESTPRRDTPPRSSYGQSKVDAELEVYRGIAEGLDAVIVNPSLVFGIGTENRSTRRLVDAVRNGRLPGVPPGNTNVVDVRDVAQGMRRAMAYGDTGERYFLGSENLSWKELVATLAGALDVSPPQRTLPPWLLSGAAWLAESWGFITRSDPYFSRARARGLARSDRYSNQKAREELGCTFRSFEKTAERIAKALASEAFAD